MTAAQASTTRGASGADETGGGGGGGTPPAFTAAVDALARAVPRAGIHLAPLPAPRRLAPYAYALEASVTDPHAPVEPAQDEAEPEELADGRFVLLHDPAGRSEWQGDFRVVTLTRADPEPEIASDPLLPEVTWSWLTGALETCAARHAAAGGTVTRSDSASFGELADRPAQISLEVRASWTPLPEPSQPGQQDPPDVTAHLDAWCELLAQCAGLPPEPSSESASVVQLPQRRGPQPR